MRVTGLALWVASTALASGCGLAGMSGSSPPPAPAADPSVFEGPLARASCGPGSRPETGIQGLADDAAEGNSCNMELIGQLGSSASWQMAAYEDCAYFDQDFPGGLPDELGTVVASLADPSRPTESARLTSPAMLDPHESLSANEARGLLGGVAGWDPIGNGPAVFDVYDLASDCAQPVLKASLPLNALGHEGNWAPDGLTYYGTSSVARNISAVDVTMPDEPTLVTVLQKGTHGMSVSDDGNRLYLAIGLNSDGSTVANGLTIVDSSRVQSRAPAAQVTDIGTVTWPDGGAAQHTIPVTIAGRPYVIFVDEGEFAGWPPGAARIIDISDETKPVVVAKLKLEVHMPDSGVPNTPASANNAHYCNVPRRDEPGIVACSYTTSGLRVFDIRDPYRPKEIAYINPPGAGNASARPAFVPERGEIWFTVQSSGFYVARVTHGAWPFTR
jgi:hypothetical protein